MSNDFNYSIDVGMKKKLLHCMCDFTVSSFSVAVN